VLLAVPYVPIRFLCDVIPAGLMAFALFQVFARHRADRGHVVLASSLAILFLVSQALQLRWLEDMGAGLFGLAPFEFAAAVKNSLLDIVFCLTLLLAILLFVAVSKRSREAEDAQAALVQARDAAEAANQAKGDFLASMSHEIRTPMTAILGYAEVLLKDSEQLPVESREHVGIVQRNGKHLLSILDGILDLSKIEAGRMTIERIPCRPRDILEEVASLMALPVKEKNLELHVEYEGPIPETVLTDPTRLRQILFNLVGNALKFTMEGSIRIVASLVEQPNRPVPFLCLEVIDTGAGIAEDQRRELFKAFSQGDVSIPRRFGGTGLGLLISKHLAKLLGGDIFVRSEVGKGTAFVALISAGSLENVRLHEGGEQEESAAGAPKGAEAVTRESLAGLRVLVADDVEVNRKLFARFLGDAGASVDLAEDGQEAVDLTLEAMRGTEPYDAVIMDMQMPNLDGHEATRALRLEGFEGPVIALTADAMPGRRERCIESGCTDFLTKPVSRDILVAAVVAALKACASAPAPA